MCDPKPLKFIRFRRLAGSSRGARCYARAVARASTAVGPFVAALIALASCQGEQTPQAEAQAARGKSEADAREVTLRPVVLSRFEQQIDISGTLAADEQVMLATKVAGRLASIGVDLASAVKRDQVVAQIETTDYELGVQQAEAALAQARALLGLPAATSPGTIDIDGTAVVRQARATLGEARANAARVEALAREGLSPEADRDSAQATLARAEAGLESAREEVRLRQAQVRQRESELRVARQRLADTAIRSPIDGYVQLRRASVGEYLAAGATVAEVVRIDPLRLRLAVPEREATLVKAGQAVRVSLEAADPQVPPDAREGRVARLAPGLDADSRSLLIEADIPNTEGQLRPGNFVHAQIVVGEREVPTLPETAIVTFAGLQKVLLVKDGKAVERPVTTGVKRGGDIEITSGVQVGEMVVEAPGALQQGEPVRPRGEK
jgi:HlyD family secretion protein